MSDAHLRAVQPDQPADQNDNGGQPPTSSTRPPAKAKQRADKNLPTDRLSFDKQVDVLEAIAQLSGPNKKPITAEDLSAAIGLKGNTGGLSNGFFRETGWIERTGRGEHAATDALIAYYRHAQLDPGDTTGARANLLPAIKHAWYWSDVLEPLLHSGGVRLPMALLALSRAAGATDSHKTQLMIIISWLEWMGLVTRDGEMIYAIDDSRTLESIDEEDSREDLVDAVDRSHLATTAQDAAAGEAAPEALTGADLGAMISINLSFRITADQAAKLSPEQLDSLLAFAEKLRA